jgi:hypothetical protein
MAASEVFLWGCFIAASIATAIVGIRLGWRAIGVYRISQAGPRVLAASSHLIWREPSNERNLDLTHGPGGPAVEPVAPFTFVEEHLTGSQPCVSVLDARERRWRVKWGDEVRSENFAVRLVWACGYFSEVTYFISSGRIVNATGLRRAGSCIGEDCSFHNARFELDDPDVRKHFEEHSWAWNDNPFLGTRELHGLKILVMLLSDWDTKDRRDVARGSNTAIFEHRISRFRREARFLITDWGGSMGRWGSNIVTRGRWDPEGFEAQTPAFVTGERDGFVNFGYAGQRTADVATGIRTSDVQWVYPYLARVSDVQIRRALAASGANPEEEERFARAIRSRIEQLGNVCAGVHGD